MQSNRYTLALALGLCAAPASALPLIANPSVLVTEHTDLNSSYAGGWDFAPRDDDNGGIAYPGHEVLLHVDQSSKVNIPAGFEFTGVAAGQPAYILPQSQDPRLLYTGFAAYDVPLGLFDSYNASVESGGRASGTTQWIRLTLTNVQGPGEFAIWQSGAFGASVLMSTAAPGATAGNSLWINAGGHSHVNTSFSSRGLYQVNLRPSAYMNDSNPATLGPLNQSPVSFPLYFSVDPGYAVSKVVGPTASPATATAIVPATGLAQSGVLAEVMTGKLSLANVSTSQPVWVLLDLADPTLAGALSVALSGFDPDRNGYQPGLNGYGLADVAPTATIDNSVLAAHPDYELALKFSILPGRSFDFEFDYSLILEGVGVRRLGVLATAYLGSDANLDGRIDIDDYFAIDRGYALQLAGYANGDFNADGRINADDYQIIDQDFLNQLPQGGMPRAIPEPAALALLAMGLLGVIRRAHHRSRRDC